MAKKSEKTKAKGLGDTLKQAFDATGITKVVETVSEMIGLDPADCGCGQRQELLNRIFPYNTPQPPTEAHYIERENGQRVRIFN